MALEKLQITPQSMTATYSVWNHNAQKTAFENLWRWRGTPSEQDPPYAIDENGNKYTGSRPDRVDPVPGERVEFQIAFQPHKPGTTRITIFLEASVRSCILGFCDDPIVWEPEVIQLP